MKKLILTSGQVEEIEKSFEMIESFEQPENNNDELNLELIKHDFLYTTVGIHPTRCSMFENELEGEKTMNELKKQIKNEKCIAIGEV